MKIRPDAWIKQFLETQLEGLTGHIYHAGFPFDRVRWGEEDYVDENVNPGWWVYEQTAYWVDGLTRCALLLENQEYLEQARKMIFGVFEHADEDGYLGPKFLKENKPWNRWPHVVFFRACMALYEYTRENVILEKLSDHYLGNKVDYSNGRDVNNIEIMLWLYGKTKKKALLDYALETYAAYNEKAEDDNCDRQALSDKKPYAHGVTYNEYFKLGAMLYIYTGDKKYLKVSVNAYEKIDQYFMLPSGCHCSNEFLINNDYMQSSETCDVTDYSWALSYLLKATEDGTYADKIETCVFNAGIGAVLEDFKGLQYFSCANQILADVQSNHNMFFSGTPWMSYRPNPGTECCPGNVNRFMPNYLLNSFMQTGEKIYSMLYAPCTVEAEIEGKRVSIQEKTMYPLEEKVSYLIRTEGEFTLHVRKPRWAKEFVVSLNGKKREISIENGFAAVRVREDCKIEVEMISEVQAHKTKGKVWFSKGPLVYSLGMKGDRRIDQEGSHVDTAFPAYNIYPNEEWRYCVTGTPTFVPNEHAERFDLDMPLPYLEVSAKVIKNMELDHRKRIRHCYDLYHRKYKYRQGDFTFTPRLMPNSQMILDEESEKKVKLYPYGACKLRMTVFNFRTSHEKMKHNIYTDSGTVQTPDKF